MSSVPTNKHSSKDAGLDRLQSLLGYHFEQLALLHLALTHKSHARQNNERLEFIGDAVLGYVVGHLLFQLKTDYAEDAMSLMRARLVRGSTLAEIARGLNLSDTLKLGMGERKSGGKERDSILADAFEAVIGAIHEDGGIEAVRSVVIKLFSQRINKLDPADLKDAKTQLQEFLQGNQRGLPEYEVIDVSGADHARTYTVRCSIEDPDEQVQASASSRRGAEQAAATLMLMQQKPTDQGAKG